jgi:photosystem II stability/assembly factor-like uncharacterized protein
VSSPLNENKQFALSERLTYSPSGMIANNNLFEKKEKDTLVTRSKVQGKGTSTGWFGAVSKTMDGGKTWQEILLTDLENDIIYFNGIACGSMNICVVVGEGYDDAGNYLTQAYTTIDGGMTWTISLRTQDVGLMQVKYLSSDEVWLAGTKKSGRNLYGQFYHSIDGGKTFTLAQVI